jgi:SAM-dependent methyltransferase
VTDDVGEFLTRRWTALAAADAPFTRPWDDLDPATARERVDPEGAFAELAGKRVLCLAAGGGQQSAAFALLGADVTVLDLSTEQLEHDRSTAKRYGVGVRLEHGDIRELGRFDDAAFDVVWQGYSINFVPDPRPVLQGVGRVLQAGGDHVFMLANPFASGVGSRDWNGRGYTISQPYVEGAEHEFDDPAWIYERREGVDVPRPREYRHTLGRVIDELRDAGLVVVRLREFTGPAAPDSEPGSWDHLKSIVPPWFRIWCTRSRGTGAASG